MQPVYVGMPPVDRTFGVPKLPTGAWGIIRCGGPCRDDYHRLRIYDQPPAGGAPVKLQSAALESFRDAESHLGYAIALTGSWRSCSYQDELYDSDRKRYAPSQVSAHCRGLAIDVSMGQSLKRLGEVKAALVYRGWHQARPDEPWHYSFGIQA